MKLKLTLLCLVSSIGMASAYTVTVTNQSNFGTPDLPILDNVGNPITGGSVAVGYFGSDDDISTNSTEFTTLLSLFNEYGMTTSVTPGAAAGLVNNVTPADWTVGVPSGTTGDQVGQSVYVVFGNGDSLANSDSLAIWKSTSIFGTEDDAGNGGVAASLDSNLGTLLLGTSAGPTDLTAGGGTISYADGIQLVSANAIPEPSTSLLAGLAGLALATRRRR